MLSSRAPERLDSARSAKGRSQSCDKGEKKSKLEKVDFDTKERATEEGDDFMGVW